MNLKAFLLGVLVSVAIFVARTVTAVEFNISGNAAGSDNTIQFQQDSSTTVQQSNQGSVSNEIDAHANTGGNTIEGGGGSIKTGDSSVKVKVTNQLNSNQANVDTCCPTPTPTVYDPGKKPTPTPTPTGPTSTSTPTPPTGGGGGNGGAGGAGGGGGGRAGGAGGGEVLGLSAASGEGKDEKILYALGSLWLVLGSFLTLGRPKFLPA